MRTTKNSIASLCVLLVVSAFSLFAQKKPHSFSVERKINVSAELIWKIIGEEFSDVSKYHSGIINSSLTHGHTKSEVGTERICLLNEKGDKYVKEKLTVYNPLEKTFTVLVSTTEGVPTVAGETFATYKVESIDENSCLLKVTQTYKTNPAIVGIFAKRKFKKSTEEHLVFIEHYASTREAVTKENHKKIKKQYH